MPFYYHDLQPTRPWGPSTTINVSLVLDQPGNVAFTNLDQISGKVVLKCAKSADLDSVVVKLEGESRTRLLSPAAAQEKQRPQLEYHKILYKVQMLFPPPDIQQGRASEVGKALTLPPGTHQYPFSFKIPFNNSCISEQSLSPKLNLSGSGLEFTRAPTRHVKKTLPPTLSGFPGEAEIRYFLKATVSRHAFWKENPRAFVPFNFLPIEPPRPPVSGTEVFARQKHTFDPFPDGESTTAKVKNLFSKSKDPISPTVGGEAPRVSVDVRLPEPAILTCNSDVPLRLIIKKLNDCEATVFLQSLQISLIGHTKIRAHDVHRTESTSWVLMSKSNMGISVVAPSAPADTESIFFGGLWTGPILPNTVAPSFATCNIERSYQLDVRVGLSYTGTTQSNPKPQNIVLPLRMDVEVYSGIAPPKALLEAMAKTKAGIQQPSKVDTGNTLDGKLKTDLPAQQDNFVPPTPMEASGSERDSKFPAYEGSRIPSTAAPVYTDAPPSYEDAIASDLPPIDAHRPNYEPPSAGEDNLLGGDEKKGFRGRRDS